MKTKIDDLQSQLFILDDDLIGHPNAALYRTAIANALQQILPANLQYFTEGDPNCLQERREQFLKSLPFLASTPLPKTKGNVSFYTISQHRPNAFKFFVDMISQWLIPHKHLNMQWCYTTDFRMPAVCEEPLTLCGAMVQFNSEAELKALQRNLPIIKTEMRLGMRSSSYARRILETRGAGADSKTVMIQEQLSQLMVRLPRVWEPSLLTEMQYVLVTCRDEFKAIRSSRHLSRIISVHYLFRKLLQASLSQAPDKRHLHVKLFRAALHEGSQERAVVGVLVGLNFLGETEIFEERHLLSAIQHYIPSVKAVPGSFFANRRGHENICTFYLEIEKEQWTIQEMRFLQNELSRDLKDRIEHLMLPVFMRRNEEELMRNILSLSNQVKYLDDPPQVIIAFDKQTYADLYFTVVIVRVVRAGSLSIQERFEHGDTCLEYIHDRTRTLGYLRKHYKKEACVFGLRLSKSQFLRRDGTTIDLNKARQEVMAELTRLLGEMRDYNGGMITQQHEVLCSLRKELGTQIQNMDFLLENFFYSLKPDVMRTILEPRLLKTFFLVLLEAIDKGLGREQLYQIHIKREASCVYVIVSTEDQSIKDRLAALNRMQHDSTRAVGTRVSISSVSYFSYLYNDANPHRQEGFCQALQATLERACSR